MSRYSYEIFLTDGHVETTTWQTFLKKMPQWCEIFGDWTMEVETKNSTIHYYLSCCRQLPASIGAEGFLLKSAPERSALDMSIMTHRLCFLRQNDSLPDIISKLSLRGMSFKTLRFDFRNCGRFYTYTANLISERKGETIYSRLPFCAPAQLLAVDFSKYPQYICHSCPKYLKSGKALQLLSANATTAILEADIFPYDTEKCYLGLSTYSFDKHSLILGASGSGKSKFVAMLINQILTDYPDQYKIVVIDPHDALKRDFPEDDTCKVTDFTNLARSTNLFAECAGDINVSVELSLSTFEALMKNNYNSYVDRVLRYTIYLLVKAKQYSLVGLRKILTNMEYRHSLVKANDEIVPESVAQFFLTEYNTLQTQHYNQAIAPIIAFIDELQMVPVFNSDTSIMTLLGCIQQSRLNIFSLNRSRMGAKVVKMIAGLLLQQLFTISQNRLISQKLIIILDEVAVIENPILARFLAELRKYQTSVILIGQYLQQFSSNLHSAIFANVANYYIFKVSQDDAGDLAQRLNLKLSNDNILAKKVEIFTGLKNRECIVQLNTADTFYPAFKAKTLDFISHRCDKSVQRAYLEKSFAIPSASIQHVITRLNGTFRWNNAENVETIMRSVTTRRKPW
mgnify:CR=1 FL=1